MNVFIVKEVFPFEN